MKSKPGSIRTYDAEGFRQRAGCICFKTDQENEILLVSSSKHSDLWVVPAGGIEPGEDPAIAAVREVQEEAGVRGKLGRFLGVFQNNDKKTRTSVYVLFVEEILETWEEEVGRRREWFTIQKAKEVLTHKPVQQMYISKALALR